jgi:hypothetical protein
MNTIFKIEKNPDPTLNNACTISGYVMDRKTKEPLIGALVQLVGTNYGAGTYIDGSFSINKIPPGKYSVLVSYIGYKPYTKSNIMIEGNYKYTLNVELVFDPW